MVTAAFVLLMALAVIVPVAPLYGPVPPGHLAAERLAGVGGGDRAVQEAALDVERHMPGTRYGAVNFSVCVAGCALAAAGSASPAAPPRMTAAPAAAMDVGIFMIALLCV